MQSLKVFAVLAFSLVASYAHAATDCYVVLNKPETQISMRLDRATRDASEEFTLSKGKKGFPDFVEAKAILQNEGSTVLLKIKDTISNIEGTFEGTFGPNNQAKVVIKQQVDDHELLLTLCCVKE